MNSQTEIYANIVGFSNYQVSSLGNVKNVITGRILKPGIRSGYLFVVLTNDCDKSTKSIHRMVAVAFIENPENKRCVDHINRDKRNNHVNNLRYATSSENNQNASIGIRNTSGIIGVSFHKPSQKWRAQIDADGRRIHLGYFINKDDAIVARENAEIYHFGEFRSTA